MRVVSLSLSRERESSLTVPISSLQPSLFLKFEVQNKLVLLLFEGLKCTGREEEEEEFITSGNWRGKHNSLSRGAGADQPTGIIVVVLFILSLPLSTP